MRLRNITLVSMILLMLTFTTGMAGATENGTANETPVVNVTGTPTPTSTPDETPAVNVTGTPTPTSTPDETPAVNVTGTPTVTLTATPTPTGTPDETPAVNVTGTPTVTLTATPTPTGTPDTGEDEESQKGIFGPGHLLYRLQIAFENMGEVFTYNASEKLGRQVSSARHRINEYRAAMKRNDSKGADAALAEYGVKMNHIADSMSRLSDNDTGFINARQMISKHQLILENLSISHPNSKGLQKAYNNGKTLQTKFASKKEKGSDIEGAGDNHKTQKSEKTAVTSNDEKPEKGKKK